MAFLLRPGAGLSGLLSMPKTCEPPFRKNERKSQAQNKLDNGASNLAQTSCPEAERADISHCVAQMPVRLEPGFVVVIPVLFWGSFSPVAVDLSFY